MLVLLNKARGQTQSPIAVQSTWSYLQKPKTVCNAFKHIPSMNPRCLHFSWAARGYASPHRSGCFCWGLSAAYATCCCEQGRSSFRVTFFSPYPARKTHGPSLHVGHLDCFVIWDFWGSDCATFGRLPFLCCTAHIPTEDRPSQPLPPVPSPHAEALCKQLYSNSVGQQLCLPAHEHHQ